MEKESMFRLIHEKLGDINRFEQMVVIFFNEAGLCNSSVFWFYGEKTRISQMNFLAIKHTDPKWMEKFNSAGEL